jgi:hypothetical protein
MNQIDIYKKIATILNGKSYNVYELADLSSVYTYLNGAIAALEPKEADKPEELTPEESPADEGTRA